MAEYPRPKGPGLERVLGTGALFSTAYGNVGSSIYYALGLVAIFAAGMTPVVFVIAGLIFAATAATYAEATTMYPEAGGSSSFARRAFNEFWSFFAAWGQMLTYIITVSISAFFVPHYLGVFWEPLGRVAGRHRRRASSSWSILGALNVVGVKESAGVNVFFAVADFLTQVLLVVVGRRAGARPRPAACDRSTSARRPPSSDFLIAIPVAMVAYTGIETISNMAEEARDYGKTIPRGIGAGGGRRGGDLRLPAGGRAVGDAGARTARPRWRCPRRRAATPTTRSWAWSRTSTWARSRAPAEIYVGILAATILFIATNAGLIGVSRLTYSMGQYRQLPERLRAAASALPHAVRRDHRLRGDRLPGDRARPGRLPRHDLRLRGDALVHDGPRARWSRCG